MWHQEKMEWLKSDFPTWERDQLAMQDIRLISNLTLKVYKLGRK